MDNLQWFKFSPSHWFMGRIQRCSEVTQARFIRLCCLYWNKECIVSVDDAKIEVGDSEFDELVRFKIVEVENDTIVIKFLIEQFEECLELGNKRSKAAKARWSKAKAMQMHTSELQDNADKNREEEKGLDEIGEEEKGGGDLVVKETDFDIFWKEYDYNVGLRQAQNEWSAIIKEMPKEIPKILENVPKYVQSKPDKKFRKKPENYLKERVWMDDIVLTSKTKDGLTQEQQDEIDIAILKHQRNVLAGNYDNQPTEDNRLRRLP